MDWEFMADDFGEDWAHEELTVAEPFASLFRLGRTRRYDLLANLLREMQLPKDAGWATERFLHHLYERVAAAHELGLLRYDDQSITDVVISAAWELQDGAFFTLTSEFGWASKLRVHTSPADYGDDFRVAFAKRFAPRVSHLLRRRSRRAA